MERSKQIMDALEALLREQGLMSSRTAVWTNIPASTC